MGTVQKKAIEEHTMHSQKNAYTILLLLMIMSWVIWFYSIRKWYFYIKYIVFIFMFKHLIEIPNFLTEAVNSVPILIIYLP